MNLLAGTLQVPHQLVKGLDCNLLLPTPPGGILDKIPHHLEVLKSSTPFTARKLCRVSVNQATLLSRECIPNVVPKAHRIAKGQIKEDNITSGIKVLAGF